MTGVSFDRLQAIASDRRVQRVVWAGVVAVLAVLCFQGLRAAGRPAGSDAAQIFQFAAVVRDGQSPYVPHIGYVYPVVAAWLLIPLTYLPNGLAVGIWLLANAAALAAVFFRVAAWVADRLTLPSRACLCLPALLLFAIFFRVIHSNLVNGQVNPIILWLCVAFFDARARERTKTAALWLALGICIKLVPAIFVPFLVVRRDWRLLGWCALLGIALLMAPALTLGTQLVDFQIEFVREILMARGVEADAMTPSARGHGEYFTMHGLLAQAMPAGDGAVLKLVALVLVGLLLLSAERALAWGATALQSAHVFCVYLLAILWISPMSEKHHFAVALPAVALPLLTATMSRDRYMNPVQVGALLAFALLLGVLAKTYPSGPFYFLAVVVAYGLVVWHGRALAGPAQPVVADAGAAGEASHADLAGRFVAGDHHGR